MIVRLSAAALVMGAALSAAPAGSVPTYSKDVAPILYQRCVDLKFTVNGKDRITFAHDTERLTYLRNAFVLGAALGGE